MDIKDMSVQELLEQREKFEKIARDAVAEMVNIDFIIIAKEKKLVTEA